MEASGGATADSGEASRRRGHVLLLPYPSQGHINPMLQFARRLASHGLTPTLATTRHILRTTTTAPSPGPVALAAISDGFDESGFSGAPTIAAYLSRLESAGSATLSDLITAPDNPVDVLVYDAFLPWALDVATALSVPAAAFFTQSCAVDAIYQHVAKGRLSHPVRSRVSLPGLPDLNTDDLPSFLTDFPSVSYPAYLELVLDQYRNIDEADLVLINSCYELERHELDWLRSSLSNPVKTIGPTVPSAYLDGRLPNNSHYGFHLFTPDTTACMSWLDTKPDGSVVYVSFGSMGTLSANQVAEIAKALELSGKEFLWVVKGYDSYEVQTIQDWTQHSASSAYSKRTPPKFLLECSVSRGLVVSWSPQLEVLAHRAVGCFVTHCRWNSTTEAISLGVPMVGMPMWTDQTTNAKYVEDVWRVGVRGRVDGEGVVRAEEVERCVREVMEGERSGEMRENAKRWREVVKKAVDEGGSSDENILGFIERYSL